MFCFFGVSALCRQCLPRDVLSYEKVCRSCRDGLASVLDVVVSKVLEYDLIRLSVLFLLKLLLKPWEKLCEFDISIINWECLCQNLE